MCKFSIQSCKGISRKSPADMIEKNKATSVANEERSSQEMEEVSALARSESILARASTRVTGKIRRSGSVEEQSNQKLIDCVEILLSSKEIASIQIQILTVAVNILPTNRYQKHYRFIDSTTEFQITVETLYKGI